MRVEIWGTRGSIARAGPATVRYGGNTACVSVTTDDVVCILDAGTGLVGAAQRFADDRRPIHILLTHLHMDHIQGLGFFPPLREPGRIIDIWGPPSPTRDLRARLTRYLSPPLFPVRIRDLTSRITIHDAPTSRLPIRELEVTAMPVLHSGPTLGYRIAGPQGALAYLPDHEPALGRWDDRPAWTSGFALASGVDLLLHDSQYTADEYAQRVGWGHSSIEESGAFADAVGARRLLLFHHDPGHDDDTIDGLVEVARSQRRRGEVEGGREGMTLDL
jgi:phosphoribosyl 1,2-cyclic phosphodiesterase